MSAPVTPPTGFWAQAAQDPARTVLIAPDGEEWTAGRLATAANRLVHGLRAAGLERGDAFAVVLPNGVEFLTAYLAATQAGLYLVPVNHHLVGPRSPGSSPTPAPRYSSRTSVTPAPHAPPPTRPGSRTRHGTRSAPPRAFGRTPDSSKGNRSRRPPDANSAGS